MQLRPAPATGALPGMLALFLISAAALGFEIALTRYFAVAKWSEYGYWVISIVLAGFALSGVVMALASEWFARHANALRAALPAALIVAAAGGFHLVTINAFNPLQLQNPTTYAPQLWWIAGYYAALLPFFFLTGLFVALSFIANPGRLGRVYGFDLTGAGAGAALVLVLMTVVHPFDLPACLLGLLAAAAALVPARRWAAVLAAVLALAGGEALLLGDDQASFNDFKAIYAPLHVPGSRTLAERRSPRGLYQLLDDFTERADMDLSNNAGQLGLPGPPPTFGLYRDGNRIAALPRPPGAVASYAPATLAALPYLLVPRGRVLLIGASGGFRIAEARALGAAQITALEPEPVLRQATRAGLGRSPGTAGASLRGDSPLAAVRDVGRYDLIDIAGDFLDAAEANATAFSVEALSDDLRALAPGGILSVPVSIREFPAYALRALATVRAALLAIGTDDPAAHVLLYRSAWNVRILVSPAPFDAARIAAARTFCDDRSFDISFYQGFDPEASRANIYNDLPPISFDTGEVSTGGAAQDAIAEEAAAVLAGRPTASAESFSLTPITLDRPAYYALLRLDHLGTLLRRLELLPQAEVGALVNLAVLAQAAVIALAVLLLPLAARRRLHVPKAAFAGGVWRAAVFFAALGLGFLAIEIALIERASFYLNDRTSAFATVLTGMLVFSGLGSMASARFARAPRRGMALAGGVVVVWCVVMLLVMQPLLLATLDWPFAARAAILLALAAPVSIALGMPFPLGLAQTGTGPFLPWAWAVNGAFSVVATPLANLMVREQGIGGVLLLAIMLYILAIVAFPPQRKSSLWQDLSAP
jgi:SAM-dependent methyltransferase